MCCGCKLTKIVWGGVLTVLSAGAMMDTVIQDSSQGSPPFHPFSP
ncbi:hypothetical protein L195_g062145, partial [Trifolium pratense]